MKLLNMVGNGLSGNVTIVTRFNIEIRLKDQVKGFEHDRTTQKYSYRYWRLN